MTAYCDYGCGEKDVVKTKDFGSGAEIAEIKGIDAAADSLADTVTNKINDALKKTEEAARNAETKEKAVDSLDTIYNETLAAIMGVKIGNYGVIDETTAKKSAVRPEEHDGLREGYPERQLPVQGFGAELGVRHRERCYRRRGHGRHQKRAPMSCCSRRPVVRSIKKMARMPTPLSTIWC